VEGRGRKSNKKVWRIIWMACFFFILFFTFSSFLFPFQDWRLFFGHFVGDYVVNLWNNAFLFNLCKNSCNLVLIFDYSMVTFTWNWTFAHMLLKWEIHMNRLSKHIVDWIWPNLGIIWSMSVCKQLQCEEANKGAWSECKPLILWSLWKGNWNENFLNIT